MTPEMANELLAETMENYEKISREFVQTRFALWHIFDYFRKFVKDGDRVLDAGCGSGRLIEMLKDFDIFYTGVDGGKYVLEFLRDTYGPELKTPPELIQSSITDLGMLMDRSFDVVFSVATLHHIPSRGLRQRALSEFYRVLKPGGRLIITNWNLRSFWAVKKYWPEILHLVVPRPNLYKGDILVPWKLKTKEVVNRYYHAFSRREIESDLESAGFKVMENRYVNNDKSSNILFGQNILTIAEK